MPSTFIISASTVVDPDLQALGVGNINYACFIKDMRKVWRKDVIAQLVDEHLDRLSQIKPMNDSNVSGVLRFELVSILAESNLPFKTNGPQTLVAMDDNKLDDTIVQHHMLFIIIRQFMPAIFSKDQTISLLWFSELLVTMSKYDLDVNFQASDWRDKFLIPRHVCGHWTRHPTWRSVDDCWMARFNPTQWAVPSNNIIDFCLVFETDCFN